ncbi:MAG: flippase-like domain-containing protein [Kofleriaceae bacterium]|nr:flippase-like domain-containing protein [Kofleriaceae bacterium]
MKTSSQRWHFAFRCLVTAAVVCGIVMLVRTVDGARLIRALTAAAPLPLLAAAVLSFAILATKGLAWQQLLAPAYAPPRRAVIRITLLAYAASSLVPLRGGEVLRVLLLQRDHDVPASHAAIVATAEKLLDVLAILLLVSPLLWLGPTLPASTAWIAVIAGTTALAALGGLAWWVQRRATLLVVPSMFKAFVLLAAGWLVDCAAIACVMQATGVAITPATVLLALLGINFAVALPSTPGQVGALQLGAVGALGLAGVPTEAALGFAVLYQAAQLLPLLVVGFALDHRLMFGNWPLPTLPRSRDQLQL